MAKKPPKKSRQFDWMTYSKPARLLSEAQESALAEGMLRPVLDVVLADPSLRLEIRARSANIYLRGESLVRLTGEPIVAEFDSAAGQAPERTPLASNDDVAELLRRIDAARAAGSEESSNRRRVLQDLAGANGSGDLFENEYVVIDIEYTYGKRRYDAVALRRTEGVTGPGGFANPRLVFVDVRYGDQGLIGLNGLEDVAGDVADFAKAAGGSHLDRARLEALDLAHQKVRLGLLPADLDVRAIDEGLPEFLVAFVDYEGIEDRRNDAPIIALHDRLMSRHFPAEHRLRFAEVFSADAESGLLIAEDDVMSYRAFKDERNRRRG